MSDLWAYVGPSWPHALEWLVGGWIGLTLERWEWRSRKAKKSRTANN